MGTDGRDRNQGKWCAATHAGGSEETVKGRSTGYLLRVGYFFRVPQCSVTSTTRDPSIHSASTRYSMLSFLNSTRSFSGPASSISTQNPDAGVAVCRSTS